MDAITRFRLLAGAARPFLIGKLRDTMKRPFAMRQARSRVPTTASTLLGLNIGLRPLPSESWRETYGEDVLAFAQNVWKGAIEAYGIDSWQIGDDLNMTEQRGTLELARMHHWPAYALAATLSEEPWRDRLVQEIDAFRDRYPAFTGPLWSVAMDSALRVHNMLLAVDWLMQIDAAFFESEQGHAFVRRVAAFAIDHALAIEAMLETAGGMATSHLLGDLLGLIAVGAYVVGDDNIRQRGLWARERLVAEVNAQVLPDGMSFEASTGYHRHVVDIVIHALALYRHDVDLVTGRNAGLMLQRQRQLESFGMPLIGDNDDGMAVKLRGFRPTTDFLYETTSLIDEVPRGVDTRFVGPLQHLSFEHFGLDLYRHSGFVLTARCGPIGQYGKGGHAHNDQNAITLTVNDEPVIVDPGSSWYSQVDARNADRSVRSHATVVVDDEEQNLIPSGGGESLWWLIGDRTKASVVDAHESSWEGVAGRHRRTIDIIDEENAVLIVIHDRIDPQCRGVVTIPVGPNIHVELHDGLAELVGMRSRCTLRWDRDNKGTIAHRAIRYSPRFAQPDVVDVLRITMSGSVITWTITLPR